MCVSDPRFKLRPLPESRWNAAARKAKGELLRIWLSSYFQVSLWLEKGQLRLEIHRLKRSRQCVFADGISWDDLQALKRVVGFGDWQAVEFYPPDQDVVYRYNMRHLWLLRDPLKFQWKKR